MRHLGKIIIEKMICLIILLLLSGCCFSRSETKKETKEEPQPVNKVYPQPKAEISETDRRGNLILNLSVQELNDEGYEAGDVITVSINEATYDMPIGLMINEVGSKEDICLFENQSGSNDIVKLVSKDDSFFFKAGLGEVELTGEDPGYRVQWKDSDQAVSVFISMKEKQGSSSDYPNDESVYERTCSRDDYPHLSDEEYANFREVKTSGMKKGILYRSSSPLNPKLNRNHEADEAIRNAKVHTVVNMADYTNGIKRYDSYEESYYQTCNIIALNMSTNFDNEGFEQSLVKGYRFIIENEGPYLIHCSEGKDRTGFASAILECLMGGNASEIVSDYMKTYCNYYGIKLGTAIYNRIAERNIKKDLAKAFNIESIYEADDLSACAEDYLLRIGMSEEEIGLLKKKLQDDNLS